MTNISTFWLMVDVLNSRNTVAQGLGFAARVNKEIGPGATGEMPGGTGRAVLVAIRRRCSALEEHEAREVRSRPGTREGSNATARL
jgi:hypothetical protein